MRLTGSPPISPRMTSILLLLYVSGLFGGVGTLRRWRWPIRGIPGAGSLSALLRRSRSDPPDLSQRQARPRRRDGAAQQAPLSSLLPDQAGRPSSSASAPPIFAPPRAACRVASRYYSRPGLRAAYRRRRALPGRQSFLLGRLATCAVPYGASSFRLLPAHRRYVYGADPELNTRSASISCRDRLLGPENFRFQ